MFYTKKKTTYATYKPEYGATISIGLSGFMCKKCSLLWIRDGVCSNVIETIDDELLLSELISIHPNVVIHNTAEMYEFITSHYGSIQSFLNTIDSNVSVMRDALCGEALVPCSVDQFKVEIDIPKWLEKIEN